MPNVYFGYDSKKLFDHAKTLERELASTQHLLHESLAREDRFYREYAALRYDNLTANKIACAAEWERDTLRAELDLHKKST
jgi:hypothetical protein